MHSNQPARVQDTQSLHKAGSSLELRLPDGQDLGAPPSAAPAEMRGPSSLPYLLFLPLGACLPLLDRREPSVTAAGIRAGMSWAHLAEGPSRRGAPQPQALLLVAGELQALGRGRTSLRLGRQEGSEAASFLPANSSEKATGPLGNLAEELNGYSRRRGGFRFRFGRG